MALSATLPHQALIDSILKAEFGLESGSFTAETEGRGRNNHVYIIRLAQVLAEPILAQRSGTKPFTCPVPTNTSKLVLRITKEHVSLEDSVKVRSEIAFLTLARDALSSIDANLCPRIFGWQDIRCPRPGGSGYEPGWVLEEYKEGQVVEQEELEKWDEETQCHMLGQLARVVKLLQDYRLPENLRKFGGLSFDDDGNMFNTVTAIPCGGPFASYNDFLRGMCVWQLKASDRSTHVNGWRDVPKLRQRLDAFISQGGLDGVLSKMPEQEPTLIHGDLGLGNVLFDPETNRLTAVLDFDLAHIGGPMSEFVLSFDDMAGILPSSAQPLGNMRRWMLKGFPKKVESRYKFPKRWDNCLAEAGCKRSSTIEGAADVADVWWFSQNICEAYWFIEHFVTKWSPQRLQENKASSAKHLDFCLSKWKY